MQLTWFGTNQKRFAHQAQSDWLKLGGTFILNLDNTVYWAKAKYEILRLLDIIHCIIISFGRASSSFEMTVESNYAIAIASFSDWR